MDGKANDEVVIDTIKQLIKEVKKEINQKKLLSESKTPKKVFDQHSKDIKEYILKNIMKTLRESENK